MPFRPPSPPPAYEMPPQYDLGPSKSADTSSSLTLAVLRPVSLTLDELEIQMFGHRITPLRLPPFEPLADPSSPSLSFSASARVNPSHVHSFENPNLPIPMDRFHFPDPMLEGVPLPAIDAQSGQGSSQLSVFPITPKPKATRARCSAPPARPASPEEEVPEAKNFEVMLWVCPPVKKTEARSCKKATKPEPISYGPIDANTDMTWGDSVDAYAELLGTSSEFLVVSSMEWLAQNSPWLPLRNASSYNSLTKQLLSPPKGVSPAYIIVKMDEPMKSPPSHSMPWVSQPVAGPSSGSGAFEATYCAVMGVDNKPSDNDDQPKKKVPFDQGLDDYMQSISEKYPPGTCSMHPEIECFHSRVNDMHYALDRPKKIVWAAAIKNGTSTILAPPLGSNHFKAKAALKKIAVTTALAPSVEPPATPAAPPAAPPLATPYPNPYGFPSAPLYPPLMGYPPFLSPFPPYQPHGFYGHPSHMLPWQDTPWPRRRERSPDRSSPPRASCSKRRHEDPPSSPVFSGGSIDEFLTQNPGLPSPTQSFLLELDFEIGDNLSVVTEAQWKAAGFTLFSWNRVLKAYNKYKNSLCH
ncbi:hypothetical protein B0H10DRAFT_2430596 [Mycena sp. CBHHK59/15]|nr:hypothetical protein B0H10DRAFT_2430596 [Mycena sp. CBHHK59/15]